MLLRVPSVGAWIVSISVEVHGLMTRWPLTLYLAVGGYILFQHIYIGEKVGVLY